MKELELKWSMKSETFKNLYGRRRTSYQTFNAENRDTLTF